VPSPGQVLYQCAPSPPKGDQKKVFTKNNNSLYFHVDWLDEKREAKLSQAYQHFHLSASNSQSFTPAHFELGKHCYLFPFVQKKGQTIMIGVSGKTLLLLSFHYSTAKTNYGMQGENPPQKLYERVDKVKQLKSEQKKDELIREKLLEANREFKTALAITTHNSEDYQLFSIDLLEEEGSENEDRYHHNRKPLVSFKLIPLLLDIAHVCYVKATTPLSAESQVYLPPTGPAGLTREDKKAKRYWRVLGTLAICEALNSYLRKNTSRTGQPSAKFPSRSSLTLLSFSTDASPSSLARQTSGLSTGLTPVFCTQLTSCVFPSFPCSMNKQRLKNKETPPVWWCSG